MKLNPTIRTARLQDLLDRINAAATPGKALVYNGTQPATAGGALSGNTLGATIVFNDPAGTVSGDTLTWDIDPLPEDLSADGSFSPTWVRVLDGDDNHVADFTAGIGSGEWNFAAPLAAGQPATLTYGVITAGNI